LFRVSSSVYLGPMIALLAALALQAAAPARAAARSPQPPRGSVVKIFTTYQKPNYLQPWQMHAPESLTGSGAIIDGGRILTNAHVVSDQTYVQVRRAGDPTKYTARVEFVGHDCELAVLRVDDPAFYAGASPLRLGELPGQRDRVAVYGFPAGGDELSITEGTVSRLEVTRYSHTGSALLAIQTDAAINPGNSGGPAVAAGKLIGVSFQSYSGSGVENIGYVVPVAIIRRFLRDIGDGAYDGVPTLGASLEKMENEALRRRHGVPAGVSGALVTKTLPGSSAHGALLAGDVLTAIDGRPLANDRTFEFRPGVRLDFSHLISMRQAGETARLDVLRAGAPRRVDVPLKPYVDLVDGPLYDRKPSYFVYAGLVFEPLTRNFMSLFEPRDQPTIFKHLAEYETLSERRTEPVVLAYVLADGVNSGYTELRNMVIDSVNGRPIARLADLPAAFARPVDGFHVIEADPVSEFSSRIVLDARKADAANAPILRRHGIAADRSPDLTLGSAATK
jgi:S1-C subfamily serine protease